MNKFKVILPANYIPEGTIVTKIKGEVEYKIYHSFNVFDIDGNKAKIIDGYVLIPLNSRNDINIIPSDKELICKLTIEELEDI